jgi:Ca2+-binding EF-hand superfamily protein
MTLYASEKPSLSDLASRIAKADTNNDGFVSRQELIRYRATQFDQLDRNHDGFISDDDMPGFAKRGAMAERLKALKAEADANRDGRMSRDEFVNGPTPVFDQLDKDGNNIVDPYEMKQAKRS